MSSTKLYDTDPPRMTREKKLAYVEEAAAAFGEDYRYAEDVLRAARIRKERKGKKG